MGGSALVKAEATGVKPTAGGRLRAERNAGRVVVTGAESSGEREESMAHWLGRAIVSIFKPAESEQTSPDFANTGSGFSGDILTPGGTPFAMHFIHLRLPRSFSFFGILCLPLRRRAALAEG